jgi:hypothetical protein
VDVYQACNGSRITGTIKGGKETYAEEISEDERGRRRRHGTIRRRRELRGKGI